MPLPDPVCVPKAEWDKLDAMGQQFLIEAEAGGMQYVAEAGEVCAWGLAFEGIFSMDTHVEPHSDDGFMVTLATQNHHGATN